MRSASIFSVVMVMLAGCAHDGGSGMYPGNEAATISLSVASADPLTSTGDTQVVTPIVRDANESVIASPSVSWRTSAPSVATVVGSGISATVTAVDDGSAIITAASGSAEQSITVTVRRRVVSIAVSAPDSVVVAGLTTQLTVVGLDARQHAIGGLTGVSFTTSNPFSVAISPSGLVTALFSSFKPFSSIVTATVVKDGVTLSGTKRIDVASAAPSTFHFSALMGPESVRPEPVNSAGEGIVFFTRDGARINYKMLWSLLQKPPTSAHIHGPDGNDAVADVLVDLPLGSQPNTNGTFSGSFSAANIHPQGGKPAISLDSLFNLFQTPGLAYVDVHTAFFADGEIRGSIFAR
jgi:hypothetical protein